MVAAAGFLQLCTARGVRACFRYSLQVQLARFFLFRSLLSLRIKFLASLSRVPGEFVCEARSKSALVAGHCDVGISNAISAAN